MLSVMTNDIKRFEEKKQWLGKFFLSLAMILFVFWVVGITPDFGWVASAVFFVLLLVSGTHYSRKVARIRSKAPKLDRGGHVTLID